LEIVCSVLAERAEEWKKIQERLMIEAAKDILIKVPCVVESSIAPYWTK